MRRRGFGLTTQEHERQHVHLIADVDQACTDVEADLHRGDCREALTRLTYASEFIGRAVAHLRATGASDGDWIASRRAWLARLRGQVAGCFADGRRGRR